MNSFQITIPSEENDNLWEHQKAAIKACLEKLRPGCRNMVQMPTGSGKNRVIGALTRELKNRQILVITPRILLVKETRKDLDYHGVLSGSLGKDLGDQHQLIIGTYQTMIGQVDIQKPDVIFIDECHLVPEDGDYRDLIGRFPEAAIIGLTATPYRGQKHIRECGLKWRTVYAISIVELINQRKLVPPISMSTSHVPSLEMLTADGLHEVTIQIAPKLVHDVKTHRRNKNLVFCVDIKHAELTSKLLRAQGETSVHVVHSNMTGSQQNNAFESFRSTSDRSWLLNIGLVTTGVNIPEIDCIVILRDVSSFSLLVQMIGRGLRLYLTKKDCLVYDFGNGTRRFGFLDAPVFSDATKHGVGGVFHFKTCPTCEVNVHIAVMTCQHCGHEFSRSSSLNELAVSRQLISRDFMVLTYKSTHQHTDAKGNVIIEHQLNGPSGEIYRAITAWASGVSRGITKYVEGTSVLVHRMRANTNLVDILG